MYLSQLILNPRSKTARRDLADRFELHRTILNAFPEALPEHERVLYRVEEGTLDPFVRILVQSQTQPNWAEIPRLRGSYLKHEPQVREIAVKAEVGERKRFRLQANPTVKRDGKRHALYDDEALLGWLMRKGEQHGFEVGPLDVRAAKLGKKHGKNRRQTWHAVQYDGVLTVTSPEQFTAALRDGIGSAKAFGFGMLSIVFAQA